MEHTYWHKQKNSSPIFSDLLWDKPENKLHAGKLLIIGGNSHSFAAPATAYNYAIQAGIGKTIVLLPISLKNIIKNVIEDCEYAEDTISGSFSKQALSKWLDLANWSDGVLLAGDLSKNSETAILVEKFFDNFYGQITITKDALDYFLINPKKILSRPDTIIVANLIQLQKLAVNSSFTEAFTHNSTVKLMVEKLHLFSTIHSALIAIKLNGVMYVAKDGDVSTTKIDNEDFKWGVATASKIAVWALQNPTKLFAAATTAII